MREHESLGADIAPVEALRMIAASVCTTNMRGDCVGATREHRIRGTGPHTDTPREYRTVVNCPKHFAQAVLEAESRHQRESLYVALREIVDAARPGTRIPPIDCTNNCGLGPCDCSGEWRVMDWDIDVPRLRQLLAEAE